MFYLLRTHTNSRTKTRGPILVLCDCGGFKIRSTKPISFCAVGPSDLRGLLLPNAQQVQGVMSGMPHKQQIDTVGQ